MRVVVTALMLMVASPVASPVVTQQPALPPSTAQVSQQAHAAIATVDAFHEALRSGDAAAVLALMTDDAVVLEEGGAERSREEYASHHLQSDIAFATASQAEISHRVAQVEGDVAWILTEGRTTGRINERVIDRRTAETMILQRSAQGWLVRHIHWSSRAAN